VPLAAEEHKRQNALQRDACVQVNALGCCRIISGTKEEATIKAIRFHFVARPTGWVLGEHYLGAGAAALFELLGCGHARRGLLFFVASNESDGPLAGLPPG
jgi:hypothetical protein